MGKIKTIITKYLYEYLDSRIIFAVDLALSILASALSLLLLNFFSSYGYNEPLFSICWLGSSLIASILVIALSRSYKVIIRHMTIKDLLIFLIDCFLKVAVMAVAVIATGYFHKGSLMALISDFFFTLLFFIGMRVMLFFTYEFVRHKMNETSNLKRIFIYGTSVKSVAALARLSTLHHYEIVGFLSNTNGETNLKLADFPVYNYENDDDLIKLVQRFSIGGILFSNDSDASLQKDGVVRFCLDNHIKPLIVPDVADVEFGKHKTSSVRDIKIEDLLGRDEINISMSEIVSNFNGKVVMVTGAAGSIGSEICRQLAVIGVRRLILFDNAETPMHNIRLELEDRFPHLSFVPVIGDVRQERRLDFAFRKYHPQIVFHAAAYKHVPLMEENPCEAVLVNVIGSRNVADKCIEYGIEKMVMISTDKAVNPTNVMGCTKRLAEIYVQSLGLALAHGEHKGTTQFVTTRFGNVLGSNGSVIPRFRAQIEKGGPVTVTHPDITRFFMTIPEAVRLVLEAATMPTSNKICVFDMGESVKIDSLARRMIELAGLKVGVDINIEYVGLRPGEKLYEEVLSNTENTEPTSHDRIRIAKVREYDYNNAKDVVDRLEDLSRAVNIPDMIILMKDTVPEYKSINSDFVKYDK